jgi:hypothetical protein
MLFFLFEAKAPSPSIHNSS